MSFRFTKGFVLDYLGLPPCPPVKSSFLSIVFVVLFPVVFVFFVFVITIPNKFPCRIVPHMLCKQPLYQAHTLRGIL